MVLQSRFVSQFEGAFQRLAPVVASALGLLFSVAVDFFDSFGIEERTDRATEFVAQTLGGPFYGGDERIGQENISVILINQDTNDELGFSVWPMPYALQAEIIERVAEHQPKAIFVDLTYSRLQRWNYSTEESEFELADYARRLERVKTSGVPIFLGPVSADQPDLDPLAKVSQAGVSFHANSDFAYRLVDPAGRKLAAATLYDIWREDAGRPPLPDDLADKTLAIDWGFGATPEMSRFLPEMEAASCRGGAIIDRIGGFFQILFRGAFASAIAASTGSDPLFHRCPYFDTAPAHWMLAPPEGFDPGELVRDRIVLIGTDLAFLSDFTETPLLGKAPGVTAHAMALDNLMENGASATRYPDQVVLGLDQADFLEFVLTLAGLGLVVLVTRARKPGDKPGWGTKVLLLGAPAIVGLLLGGLVFHWPAVNVVGVVSAGALALLLQDLVKRAMKRKDGEALPPSDGVAGGEI